jgi:FkbM family methyltransferase
VTRSDVRAALKRARNMSTLSDRPAERLALARATLRIWLTQPWGTSRAAPMELPVRCRGRLVRCPVASRHELETVWWIFGERAWEVPGVEAAELVLDIGANTGHSTLWFAARFPGVRVIAVEADPEAAGALRRNVAHLPDVEVREVAVARRSGTVTFNHSADTWASSLLPTPWVDGHVEVQAITLDGLLAELGDPEVSLLKLNVEGAEWDIVRETSALGRVGAIVGEFHDDLCPVPWEQFSARLVGFHAQIRGHPPHRPFFALPG